MSNRVFVDDLSHAEVRIEDSEAHHLLHVLRMKIGDYVELFDGIGNAATGRIITSSRRHAQVLIESRWTMATDDGSPRLCVAAAPAKGDRLKWMVEKLTELGVNQLVLLQTERTIVTPGDTKLDKLRASIIAACKQCRRNHLMTVQSLTPLKQVLHESISQRKQLVIAHPADDFATGMAAWTSPQIKSDTLLLIGPEGGFTSDEVQQAAGAGAKLICWPQTILRIETAAVALAAVVMSQQNASTSFSG